MDIRFKFRFQPLCSNQFYGTLRCTEVRLGTRDYIPDRHSGYSVKISSMKKKYARNGNISSEAGQDEADLNTVPNCGNFAKQLRISFSLCRRMRLREGTKRFTGSKNIRDPGVNKVVGSHQSGRSGASTTDKFQQRRDDKD